MGEEETRRMGEFVGMAIWTFFGCVRFGNGL